MSLARHRHARVFSVRKAMAIDLLARGGLLPADQRARLHALRATRNTAAHQPSKLMPGQLVAASPEIEALRPAIQALGRTGGTL